MDMATHEIEKFFDNQVKGLGDNFSESLGAGDYSSLDRGSPQFANREAIAPAINYLPIACQPRGTDRTMPNLCPSPKRRRRQSKYTASRRIHRQHEA